MSEEKLTKEEKHQKDREYYRTWFLKDPERVRAIRRTASKRYRQNHPEKERASHVAWGKRNPEKKRLYDKRYREKNYDKIRARRLRDKEKELNYAKIYREKNREMLNLKAKVYRSLNKEKRFKFFKQWHENNPGKNAEYCKKRRAMRTNAAINDFTNEQWEIMKAHFKYRCVYCGKKPKKLTQDHITPLIDGGNHTAKNIVPACAPCNYKKNRRAPLTCVQPMLLI